MSLFVDIRKDYKDFSLDLSFQTDHETLGILGASGCGKSLTLQCIAGIKTPDSGRIVLNDRVLFDSEKKIDLPPQKRKIGYLFQNYALFPNMTVAENIGVVLERSKRAERMKNMVSLFHLNGLEQRYPRQLSGGQQQRTALARIFACDPEILMLDEPFSALDAYLKEILQQELLEILKEYKKDILFVSHNRDEVYQFSSLLAVIEDGKIAAMGETAKIFADPACVSAARLTGCKNIASILKKDDNTIEVPDWGVILHTAQSVSDAVRYIGIRAHDLLRSENVEEENRICCKIRRISHTPFESNIMMFDEQSNRDTLWWKIKKEPAAIPLIENQEIWLQIPKESILLLK